LRPTFQPSLGQSLRERRDAFQSSLIALDRAHKHADAPQALALLRVYRKRPSCRTAEERDEFAPFHVLPQAEDHTLAHWIAALCSTAKLGCLRPLMGWSGRAPALPG